MKAIGVILALLGAITTIAPTLHINRFQVGANLVFAQMIKRIVGANLVFARTRWHVQANLVFARDGWAITKVAPTENGSHVYENRTRNTRIDACVVSHRWSEGLAA
jgi:hypothetical protein